MDPEGICNGKEQCKLRTEAFSDKEAQVRETRKEEGALCLSPVEFARLALASHWGLVPGHLHLEVVNL